MNNESLKVVDENEWINILELGWDLRKKNLLKD